MMSDSSKPALVGSHDGLGPLPEPEELDWNRHAEPVFGYTRQQMEAERQRCYALAVAAERERCAKLCLRPPGWLSDSQQALADEIRNAILGNAGRLHGPNVEVS